ncbi:MAG: alanine racemase [Alphaproteobacteria bacterium]
MANRANATGKVERAVSVFSVDLDAIADNYRYLRERLGGIECAAVVKADGYGVGAAKVAQRLHAEGCRHFFCAHFDEAIALRPLLRNSAIYVLNGLIGAKPDDFVGHDVIPVLNDLGQVYAWSRHSGTVKRREAVFHFDTGMTRLGLEVGDAERLALSGLLDAFSDALVMSHLACSEERDNPMNRRQLERFHDVLRWLPQYPASLANSSGIFLGGDFHFDMARPGYALYGGNPLPDQPNPMRNAVRLESMILQVRAIVEPRTVGYGATYKTDAPSRIATIALGYADGYVRGFGNRGQVVLAGRKLPVVGRVSMDLVTIDVTDVPEDLAQPGTYVDVLGEHNPIDEAAARAGTIGYELLTRLGKRFARRYIGAVDD